MINNSTINKTTNHFSF